MGFCIDNPPTPIMVRCSTTIVKFSGKAIAKIFETIIHLIVRNPSMKITLSFCSFIKNGGIICFFVLLSCFLVVSEEVSAESYTDTRSQDPIDWMVWNQETYKIISEGNRPILFSVSHELNDLTRSMAEESFQNAENADVLNKHFYCVLIDQYEHPQLVSYFKSILQGTKQIVGFPQTIFLAPDLSWLEGGGYFPPSDTWGGQGFPNLLKSVIEKWTTDPAVAMANARKRQESFQNQLGIGSNPSYLFQSDIMQGAVENLLEVFDPEYGGFFVGPKTPDFATLRLLDEAIVRCEDLYVDANRMKSLTRRSMECSSLYDFVNGGFFASASDDMWLIPQFMKSVDTQCQAIHYYKYAEGYEDLVLDLADSIYRNFKMENGLFSSNLLFAPKSNLTVESALLGANHFWDYKTVSEILDDDELTVFLEVFDISERGNIPEEQDPEQLFKEKNLLRLKGNRESLRNPLVASGVKKLKEYFDANNEVIHEKTVSIVSNARVVSALAIASGFDVGNRYLEEAMSLFDSIWKTYFVESSNRLMTASIHDEAKLEGESDALGYALLIQGAIELYKITADQDYLRKAKLMQKILSDRFTEVSTGLCFVSPGDSSYIPVQTYAFWEESDLSAVAAMISNLKELSMLSGESQYQEKLELILNHLPEAIEYAPEHFPSLISILLKP